MIVVTGVFRFAPGGLEPLREIAANTVRETRGEEGCLAYSFAQDLAEPDLVRVYEEWESRDALAAHGKTAHIAAWRQALGGGALVSRELKLVEIDAFEPFG